MLGKLKCKYLKKYRELIAKEYDIKGFKYKECKSKGECIGTCPKCEEELKELNVKVNEKIEKMSTTFGGLNLGYNDKFIKSVNSKLILNDEDDGWNFIENKYRFIELSKTLDNVDCHTPIKLYNYRINKSKDILSELICNPSKTVGKIFGIERLCINTDGEGITTLVGMAGCPLNCKYCINKDIGIIHNITVDELYDLVLVDDLYYNSSNGGICFGGNEPLLQADFILSFIEKVRKEKKTWKIGIETSLTVYDYSNDNSVEKLLKNVDYIIADIKSMDKLKYQNYTNCNNMSITSLYKNLEYLVQNVPKNKITIKVPTIPYFTEDEDVSNSIKDLLEIGFLYKNIKVIDYIVPKDSKIDFNDEHLEGEIDSESLNDIDGFIEIDEDILENCRLEGELSLDAYNEDNSEDDIPDLDINISESQSEYKNKGNYFNDYFKISEGAIKEIKYNKNQ